MGKDQTASATMQDVDAWKAFGGKVEGKVYVAPGGECVQARGVCFDEECACSAPGTEGEKARRENKTTHKLTLLSP